VPANTFTTDTLNPPPLLWPIVWGSDIFLQWTSTPNTYATGYRVLRSTTHGGPYTQVDGPVTPYTTTTFLDNTVDPGIRYYYVLQTYFSNWTSVYSMEANDEVPLTTGWRSPTAEAAVTSNSGDNNGFQSNPTYAFAADGSYAEDASSGTAGSQDCTSTARDRHLFYTYGFDIPINATIEGIAVRLDAWADSSTDSPKMCVQLSWDGGTTWTTATPDKTTEVLYPFGWTWYLGSTTDTWGHTWTSTQLSDTFFRLRITNIADSALRSFRLDWVSVNVTYTPP
jgi:hypothetical protein